LVLLSQDEARFQMVPTLSATLGVKGHRPTVGTRDCKDVLYVFSVLNLTSGALHANTLESLQAANRKSQESKTRRMQLDKVFFGNGSTPCGRCRTLPRRKGRSPHPIVTPHQTEKLLSRVEKAPNKAHAGSGLI
jgi:hypothetical protein